ncbi:IS200/IS605 family element transposase accessory protein TnpB [Candidatus Woesearchaeota archaeon]|nr:IS200/IS605 family element transposase accessory protein TnpB [Candidatus Woesearchaeota archaeon]
MQRAIKLCLPRTKELLDTVATFNRVVQEHINKALVLKTTSKAKLHCACYKRLRAQYPALGSMLVQIARDQAIACLKANKLAPTTTRKPLASVLLNARVFSANFKTGKVSIRCLNNRRTFKVNIPDYFQKYVGWDIQACTLKPAKGRIECNIIVEGNLPTIVQTENNVLGIDSGIKNVVALSNGVLLKGSMLNGWRRRVHYLRNRLKSKGTRSSKRSLKRLGAYEQRRVRDFNHGITKNTSNMPYNVFALEDLEGVRKGRKGKTLNRMRAHWSFYQFRTLLSYKAESLGKRVVLVNPAFTSQTCSDCGKPGTRQASRFSCQYCGLVLHSDLNASVNISYLGNTALVGQAPVNVPIVTTRDGVSSLHTCSS